MPAPTPQQIAEADQGFAAIVAHLVPHWYRMFQAMVDEGFTEAQAIDLLKAYVVREIGGH